MHTVALMLTLTSRSTTIKIMSKFPRNLLTSHVSIRVNPIYSLCYSLPAGETTSLLKAPSKSSVRVVSVGWWSMDIYIYKYTYIYVFTLMQDCMPPRSSRFILMLYAGQYPAQMRWRRHGCSGDRGENPHFCAHRHTRILLGLSYGLPVHVTHLYP